MKEERKSNIAKSFTTIVFYLTIIIFFVASNFTDSSPSGWYQQFMPNLGGRQISDIFFLDSLTGWAVTPYTIQYDTAFVVKTTNGGDNWFIASIGTGQFVGGNKIKFININTGFIAGSVSPSYTSISKTTNGGINWFNIGLPAISSKDMSVLNEDTIWFVDSDALVGGAFLTTNGGLNWQVKYSGANPSHIYMYNSRIGFIDGGNIKKTTDGGNTWTSFTSEGNFVDIYFIDSLTGWKSGGGFKMTTNGGINWTLQNFPQGSEFLATGISRFSAVNKDTLWGVGGIRITSLGFRGIIYKSTNKGNKWGYQLPDTNINISGYSFNKFFNKLNGWAYADVPTGVHTNTGGSDSTIYTGINNSLTLIPKDYMLFQNYPNPFNSTTNVRYKITKSEVRSQKLEVRINVFDILGKKIEELVNKNQSPGDYEVKIDGNKLSSGIYFYSLIVDGNLIDTKKMLLIK